MKLKHLILLMSSSIAASSIVSCTDEPYVISAKEEYTRNFIKTFGLIDPNQDWTAATRGNITVVTSDPTTVRIIADVDGKTYLFGQYADIQGEKTLNFDIPKNAKNVVAIANGKHYPVENGQRLNLSESRAVNSGSHGSTPTVKVEVLSGSHSYLTLTKEEIQSFTEKLGESQGTTNTYEDTNLGEVTQNFLATAKEIWLFPQYWNTNSYKVNQYGVYFYVDESEAGREGVEAVVDVDGKTHYIKKIIVFDGLIEQLQTCKYDDVWQDSWFKEGSTTKDYLTPYIDELIKRYPDRYKIADGTEQDVVNNPWNGKGTPEDGCHLVLMDEASGQWAQLEGYFPDVFYNDMAAEFTDIKVTLNDWGGRTLSIPAGFNSVDRSQVDDSQLYKGEDLRSTGVHVSFTNDAGELVDQKFGFFINATDDHAPLYSESSLNGTLEITYDDGSKKTIEKCFMATYKADELDSGGNEKRYLCFEDWYNVINYDLNDVVFRIYGLDKLRGEDKPSGGIDDKDSKDTIEEYPLYPWIIACEDLGVTDDYDFNDVVFGVEHISGTQDVFVTALAAGGTLKAHLYYTTDNGKVEITGSGDNQSIVEKGSSSGGSFSEWHQWFGVNDHTRMLNTTGYNLTGATVKITLSKEDADKFSLSNEIKNTGWAQQSISHLGGFFIMVEQESGETLEIMAPYRSKDDHTNIPQMFQTTSNYQWPKERVSIYTSHAGNGAKIGETPTGQPFYENSFMHWVNAGDVAKFHETDPSSPNSTIKHGWTGDVKIICKTTTTTTTDENGNVTDTKIVTEWTGEAYGNKYNFDSDPR